MRHVANIASRDLRALFVSPVAYGVLSLFAILAGFFFILHLRAFDATLFQAQQYRAFDFLQEMNLNDNLIKDFYASMSFVLLLLIPAITMGLLTSEKANGTQEMLLTSPLRIWDIVIGKFFAAAGFVALLVAVVGLLTCLLFVYGDPEPGKTFSGMLGLLLVGWTYAAVGVFASSLTRSQVVAFLIALVLLLCLLLVPAVAEFGMAGASGAADLLRWLSATEHFEPLANGLVDTADLAYFAVMIAGFLVLTHAVVESVRWR